MKACGFCGTVLPEESGDFAYCQHCEDEMMVITLEETETSEIKLEICFFEFLDLRVQRDYIMASEGTDNEKVVLLNECLDKYFERQ